MPVREGPGEANPQPNHSPTGVQVVSRSGSGPGDPGLPAAAPVLAPGEIVADRYVVQKRLGAGGMGEAWLAEDRVLHRRLVLKRLTDARGADAGRASQVLSEARRATAIPSPHIAQVFDVCSHAGEWLLAMEYVPGQDLRTLLVAPLDAETFFSLAVQVTEAIEAAHASGILHCDIKPENIMVTEQGFVKVLDFGLARLVAAPASNETVSLPGSGTLFAGTPGYTAPEVLREHAPTEQSDIFALGVVLYEMAGGKAPFKGKTTADSLLLTLTAEPAQLNLKERGLPADLQRVITKALSKQPERRYATARDLTVDLKSLQHQALSGVYSVPRAAQSGRGKLVPAVIALALLAVVLLVVLFLVPWHLHRVGNQLQGSPAASVKTPPARLVAVLPFHVVGPESAAMNAYSEGLREAITTSLANVAAAAKLEVLAASEVRVHGLRTPEDAHRELGADLAIDGSYQQFRNQVHITYELSDATGKILQSGTVTETLTDPFALENHVVSGVLAMLQAGAVTTPAPYGTQNAAAYDAYLRGVGYLRDFDRADSLKNAEASFAEATQADPHFAAAWAGLGEAQWAEYQATTDIRKIPLARASCGQALELAPSIAEAHICRATMDDGTGQTAAAQAEYSAALRLDPQSDTALNGLAHTWEQMEKPDQAEHVYRQATAARPSYWANYYALANFLMRRADYAGAAQVLEEAAAKFPENSFLARRLGVVYFLEGRLPDAARILEQAIAEQPHAQAYMDLGQVYLHQRAFARAIPALEAAARMRPENASIQADLGDAYAWSGAPADKATARYRNALALSEASLRVNPQDLDALMVSAYCAAALGGKQKALADLSQALDHAPEDAEVNYYAARVHARLGETAAAQQAIHTAIAHGYSQADIATAPDLAALAGTAPPK